MLNVSTLKIGDEMNLPRDFAKAERRIEMLPDGVLCERFNLGVSQSVVPEVIQRMFDELATDPLAPKFRVDRNVGDMSDSRLIVSPSCDAANDAAIDFRDKNPVRITSGINIQMPTFTPLPIVTVNRAEEPLDSLVNRYAVKRRDRDRFQCGQVIRSVRANEHDC